IIVVLKENRDWADTTKLLTIEKFSAKFTYSESQAAYDAFTAAVINSKRKTTTKNAELDGLKTWKERKTRAALFWLGQRQASAIEQGKSVIGTSMVEAAADDVLKIIQNM
ncbi:hypothetical protein BGZ76_006294, partial [Entomortierella beljakovae]